MSRFWPEGWEPGVAHKTAAEMFARGCGNGEVAKEVNRKSKTIYAWRGDRRFKDLIEEYRSEQMREAGKEYQARLRNLISKSLDNAEKLVQSGDNSVSMEMLKVLLKTKHLGVAAFGPVAGGAKEEITHKHENLPVIKVQYGDNEPESS